MPEQTFTGSLQPGSQLGKYEVGEQIATGGMAVIYKAYDPSLDRSVAVKQIAPHLAQDQRFLERFRVEAQTLARLSSSQANIVNVHELIQQNGQLFLVMEYVEGTTLRVLMDRGPVPLQTGLGVLLSTALGLKAMHKNDIVHRDLTPGNIMMAKDGALKITDFGLIGHSGGKTSLPMGTTKYMAPEMFTGAPVDGRADIYSLGFIAYEMFAGPEKFGEVFRDVLRDERAQQVRWMHWHSNPAQGAPSLKDLQPGIPPLVIKIVERMMEKDPSKRFASADQIIKWLRRIFVMHVQGKSISQDDSASLEQEMEADASGAGPAAGVSGPPARRPAVQPQRQAAGGAATQTAAAGVPAQAGETALADTSGEKTAPLPERKWTWKRATFWAAIIAGPLIAAATALIIWQMHVTSERMKEYNLALTEAKSAYKKGEYEAAMDAFDAMVTRFADLPNQASQAAMYAKISEAEFRLGREEWDKAAEAANVAEERHFAPAQWAQGFWDRLNKAKEVKQGLQRAETAAADGNYSEAVNVLRGLQDKYDLDVADQIAQYREKQELVEYNKLMDKAREHLANSRYSEAQVAAEDAQKIRNSPEVKELLADIKGRKQLSQLLQMAQKAEQEKSWGEAAMLWEQILAIKPSENVRRKMNHAKAEELATQAKKLMDAGVKDKAYDLYAEVLTYNPEHPDALQAMRAAGRQKELDEILKAARTALKKGDWQPAINSYERALTLIDPQADAKLKKDIEDNINQAKYRMNIDRGREAIQQKNWDEAEDLITAAQSYDDTDEARSLLKQIDTRRRYYGHLDVGKELLEQLNYVKAREALLKAKEVMDTTDVRNLLTEVDYRRYFAQGKSLFADRQYKRALAMLHLAQKAKDTLEIQGYLDMVHRMMAAQEQENG